MKGLIEIKKEKDKKAFNTIENILLFLAIGSLLLLGFGLLILTLVIVGKATCVIADDPSLAKYTNENIISIEDNIITIDEDCVIEIKKNESDNTTNIIISKNGGN